jgi:anti-sigma B factor antagonist
MPDEFEIKPFRCKTEQRDGTTYLRPHGELDMRTVPELDAHMKAARETGRCVVLDLRGLSFMDSTGISLVTRWNLEARRDGFDFALIQGDARIQRLFELTALTEYFAFVDG